MSKPTKKHWLCYYLYWQIRGGTKLSPSFRFCNYHTDCEEEFRHKSPILKFWCEWGFWHTQTLPPQCIYLTIYLNMFYLTSYILVYVILHYTTALWCIFYMYFTTSSIFYYNFNIWISVSTFSILIKHMNIYFKTCF